MPALLLARIQINDPEAYKEYVARSGPAVNNTPKRVDFGPRQWQTPLLCCLKRTSPSPSHRPRPVPAIIARSSVLHTGQGLAWSVPAR